MSQVNHRGVAQSGSALALGARSPGFKSRRPDKSHHSMMNSGFYVPTNENNSTMGACLRRPHRRIYRLYSVTVNDELHASDIGLLQVHGAPYLFLRSFLIHPYYQDNISQEAGHIGQ